MPFTSYLHLVVTCTVWLCDRPTACCMQVACEWPIVGITAYGRASGCLTDYIITIMRVTLSCRRASPYSALGAARAGRISGCLQH